MDKKLDLNTKDLNMDFNLEIPSVEEVPAVKLQQAESVNEIALDIEKDITKVKDMISREGFSVGKDTDIEGHEILGLFLGNGIKTSLQELMQYDDNDLDYMDEQTKRDYLLYKEKYMPKTEEFELEEEEKSIFNKFKPKGK